ncbi:molybdopterin synthase catalytic subunit [Motilibacter peucedani]|uniref:Molybdopterin synthase catalytic subunit n=1 Tax=Motilibacter peucedani TaxID=598650 RepID=A0A420XMM8_9ACTN|nr:molybdenum cofactor biosynthesis protein MoaE [Motilibacter peucedani]RKS72533.1 molybdopterin synthase catalytic subunit [Motilibacter peucedani]
MSRVRLTGVRDAPLEVAEVLAAVDDVRAGGVVSFVGTVRVSDGGREVTSLGYTAHPTAPAVLAELAEEAAARAGVVAVAVLHREGDLGLGEVAVVAAVAAEHRGEAFAACQQLVDELKARAPIWKHQRFADGTDEWVGTP